MLKKELKNSDVGSLGRIVLPKVKFVQKSCLFVWFYVVCGSFFVFVGKVERREKRKRVNHYPLYDCDLDCPIANSSLTFRSLHKT